MVSFNHDDVLDFGDLAREQNEMKERCKTLERENSMVG